MSLISMVFSDPLRAISFHQSPGEPGSVSPRILRHERDATIYEDSCSLRRARLGISPCRGQLTTQTQSIASTLYLSVAADVQGWGDASRPARNVRSIACNVAPVSTPATSFTCIGQEVALKNGLQSMAQIFHPGMNILAKVTIFGAVFIIAGFALAGLAVVRSPFVTQVNVVREQPVPFSHQHHVRELGLDCRYCHHNVEKAASAGIPATEICMGCHSQIWKDAEVLRPVRDSFAKGEPLKWTRVHDLPDFVYFNHQIHVAKGVGCESCHGRVDEMPQMRRAASLHMDWCLKCHRHPELAVRPREDLFQFGKNKMLLGNVTPEPLVRAVSAVSDDPLNSHDAGAEGQVVPKTATPKAQQSGPDLVTKYGIVTRQLTDCVVCHR